MYFAKFSERFFASFIDGIILKVFSLIICFILRIPLMDPLMYSGIYINSLQGNWKNINPIYALILANFNTMDFLCSL